jgi:hypothetical protein
VFLQLIRGPVRCLTAYEHSLELLRGVAVEVGVSLRHPGRDTVGACINYVSGWNMLSILTFVTENEQGPGRHGVQGQFPGFTINCVALDLSFAQEIRDFVAETRANPGYRDISLGEGKYRHMPEKSVDRSPHFSDLEFRMLKLGDCDHGYLVRISARPQFWLSFELHEKQLDDFLEGLCEVVEN